jgi:imidazolonepropionase-like amidohydrolase
LAPLRRAALLVLAGTLCWLAAPAPARADAAGDLAQARALFQRNLDAIRHRDRAAYLACYLHAPTLARTGFTGFTLSYDSLAATAGSGWPDGFEASDLRLTKVAAGVVYGTYRYRVRYGDDESAGISERLFLETAEGWRIAVSTAFPAPAGTPAPDRALVGATLIDGTGKPPVREAVIVIRQGKIACAGPRARCPVPAGMDTMDLRGLWVTPGLVDAHVHYSQTGWADGRPDALDLRDLHPYEEAERRLARSPETFHRAYLACGVTAVFDVGGYPWTLAMAAAAENDTRAPRVRAVGPVLSTIDHWLNLPGEKQILYLSSDSTARADVQYLKGLGASAVKIWFIVTPTRDFGEMTRVVMAAGDEARRLGLPLIVHATGLREAKVALRAGARVLVHSVMDVPVDEEFVRLMKRNGTIYCPTLTVIDGYGRMYDAARSGTPPAVDDPLGAVDSLTLARVASTAQAGAARVPNRPNADHKVQAERDRVMAINLKRVRAAGIPIATGTDAGNPLTLHGPAIFGEMETMAKDGMTPMEVLVASTRGGARAMGRDDFGTVTAGMQADLVVLEANPLERVSNWRKIRYVVRSGVVRSREELKNRR